MGGTALWRIVAAIAMGSWWAGRSPWLAVLVALGALLAFGHRAVAPVVGFAVAALLAWHAWTGLDRPLLPSVDAVGAVVRDPEPTPFGGVRAVVRLDGRHYEVDVKGGSADVLAGLAAGDHVHVRGRTSRLMGRSAPSLRRRHIAGRVRATSVVVAPARPGVLAPLNAFRSAVARGAQVLPADERAVLTGLVYGDDRSEPTDLVDDFRRSGLTHLLAVSGENVAFVLIVVGPLLRCFPLLPRTIGALGALVAFGAMVRWEPSVVRAVVMAAIVLGSRLVGRPVELGRCLGMTVMASLLLDPFLIGSVGFLLSVCACAGIVALLEPIARRLVGPPWLRRAVACTVAAQIGAAPVQVVVFGGVPAIGVVANVLAEPVAAVVMMWGLVAGPVAGLLGGPIAALLHVPDRVLLGWLLLVARTASRWSSSPATVPVVLGAMGAWLVLSRARRRRGYRHPT